MLQGLLDQQTLKLSQRPGVASLLHLAFSLALSPRVAALPRSFLCCATPTGSRAYFVCCHSSLTNPLVVPPCPFPSLRKTAKKKHRCCRPLIVPPPWLLPSNSIAFASPALTHLDLSANPWLPELFSTLGQVLKAGSSLAELRLTRLPAVSVQGTEYNTFIQELAHHTALTSLDLSETPVRSPFDLPRSPPVLTALPAFQPMPSPCFSAS